MFEAKGGASAGELHLLIEINPTHPFVWVCGQKKESLMHSQFMLDKNVQLRLEDRAAMVAEDAGVLSAEPLAAGDINELWRPHRPAYAPPAAQQGQRVEWKKVKLVSNECRELQDLPGGTHVLSISTDPSQPTHVSDVTHVVMWR